MKITLRIISLLTLVAIIGSAETGFAAENALKETFKSCALRRGGRRTDRRRDHRLHKKTADHLVTSPTAQPAESLQEPPTVWSGPAIWLNTKKRQGAFRSPWP
jgi:hypothetical protein